MSTEDLDELARAIDFDGDDPQPEVDAPDEFGQPNLLTPSDVLDMAAYLGIDTTNELWLLPLARDAVLAELPPGWVEKIDSNGDPYFVDLENDVTTSEHPTDDYYMQKLEDAREAGPPKKVPKWMEFMDENTKAFYYNFKRNIARYEADDEVAPLPPQPAAAPLSSSKQSKFSQLRDLPVEAGEDEDGDDGDLAVQPGSSMLTTMDIGCAAQRSGPRYCIPSTGWEADCWRPPLSMQSRPRRGRGV
jgi:hypothetical protein